MNVVPEKHTPVLADTLCQQISLSTDAIMVDATIGHGGHAYLLAKKFDLRGHIIGFDVDPASLEAAREKLKDLDCKVTLIRENFSKISEKLKELEIEKADMILADLGWCSAQLEDHNRGLSYQENMPLDMRLDERLKKNAANLVNELDEESLAQIIHNYGQQSGSRKIAAEIARQRKNHPITTTGQLANLIFRAVGGNAASKSRVFQALRIEVNRELGVLGELLESMPTLLKPQGYAAVISFHSLEDRMVKENFAKNKINGIYELLTKKPITASRQEIRQNRRSRSAKLRIAIKQ